MSSFNPVVAIARVDELERRLGQLVEKAKSAPGLYVSERAELEALGRSAIEEVAGLRAVLLDSLEYELEQGLLEETAELYAQFANASIEELAEQLDERVGE